MTSDTTPLTTTSTVEERNHTFRRVYLRIIPFAFLVYVIAWIDKANIGFAKLTMLHELGWSEAIYGLGAGVFFLGYFFFEVPSNLLLMKIGAPKTIMRIALGWGSATLLMAFITQPWQFYSLRFLQGAFEAGLHPGLILYLTFWLPAHRRARALSIFMVASPVALLVGSPLAGYIMQYAGGALSNWQWIFIIEGIPSIILGILTLFLMTEKPSKAKWLSREEHDQVAYELATEAATLSDREQKVWPALRNPAILALIVALFCILAGNTALAFYGPSLVESVVTLPFATLGWIMSGIFALGGLAMLFNGWWSDRHREARWHTAGAAGLGALGLVLAAVALVAGSGWGVILALALSAIGTMGSIPVFWSMPPLFVAGRALGVTLALINSIANLAGFFSPAFLGIMKTNTGSYSTGLLIIAGVEAIGAVLILTFVRVRRFPVPNDKEGIEQAEV